MLLFHENKMSEQSHAADRQFAAPPSSQNSSFWQNFCRVVILTLCFVGCSQEESPVAPSQNERSVAVNDKPQETLIRSHETEPNQTRQTQLPAENPKEQGGDAIVVPQAKVKSPEEKQFDRKRLNALGFEVYESRNLLLVSDGVQPEKKEIFEKLPEVVVRLTKRFLADYPQTPDQIQLTGYVMRDRSLYLQADLLPNDFANLAHGLHKGYSFWMNEQKTDYYRRHLLIHEAVHCLMDVKSPRWPLWYLEGMAEFYAVHQIGQNGEIQFGVAPSASQIAGGFGRLQLIRDEIKAGRFRTISKVRELNLNNFYPHKTSYAWSWALCYFLATHPETQKEFQQLGMYRDSQQFDHFFEQAFPAEDVKLNAQWAVFASSLVPDYDIKTASITWSSSPVLNGKVQIRADRNWQASGISLVMGKQYRIEGSGQFTVAQEPVPWESEPQGVSIEYVDGQPLGQLQAALYSPTEPGEHRAHGFLRIISVGRQLILTPDRNGELFFRVNDRGSSWSNNKGGLAISVEEFAE